MSNELSVRFLVDDSDASKKTNSFSESLKKLNKEINSVGNDKGAKVGSGLAEQADKLRNSADSARKSLLDINRIRIGDNLYNGFTKELTKAQTSARSLYNDISSIKKELSNPHRTASKSFLASELQAAERELSSLERKIDSYNRRRAGIDGNNTLSGSGRGSLGRGGGGNANNLKLSSFQKQNLSYQINDVLTMAAMGADPAQIIASQAGQIAQIFNPAQITAFTAAYGGLVTVLGVGAAAIGLTYKITGDIRAEAERRLKVEEKLSVEYGKQVSAGREIWENYRKQGIEAQRNFEFGKYLDKNNNLDSLETLRQRQKTLEVLGRANSSGIGDDKKRGEQQLEEARQIRDLIRNLEDKDKNLAKNSANNAMRLGNEGSIRQMEMNEEAEKRRLEAEKNRRDELEKTRTTILNLFDSMSAKSGANNPFVSFYSESEKAARSLQETTKDLTKDVFNMFDGMRRKQEDFKLFELRLNSKLEANDLREQARSLRNPEKTQAQIEAEQEREKQRFNRIAAGGYNWNTNPAAVIEREEIQRKLANKEITEEQAKNIIDARNQSIYQNAILKQANDFSGAKNSTFNDLNQQIAVSFLAQRQLKEQNPLYGVNPNQSAQERLDSKINIIRQEQMKFGRDSQEFQLADRQLLAVGQSLNPSEMRADQREMLASAAEREATRKDNQEKEARKQIDDLKTQVQILVNLFTEGKAKLDTENFPVPTTVVNAGDGVKVGVQAPKPKDTADRMNGKTWYDEYQGGN